VSAAHVELARRLFDAIAAGDVPTVRACYAEDGVLRNHTSGQEYGAEEIARIVGTLAEQLPDRRYEEIRVAPTPSGFVQQHVVRATGEQGPFAVRACCVGTVVDGRVALLEEYASPPASEAGT
jgi:ketosteroid isomerase-like protein